MSSFLIGSFGILIMFVLILLRQPIWLSLLICGIVGNFILNSFSMSMFVTSTSFFDVSSGYGLSVIPLFILMGEIASKSKMSRNLFNSARIFMSGLKGALSMSSIVASGAFGAISGSSIATAASMTRIAYPEMSRAGYEEGYSAASIAAGGTLGILIPPSIILVIYASIAEASVARLFAASMIPGIILLFFYIFISWFLAKEYGNDKNILSVSLLDRFKSLFKPWDFLLIFLVTIGGIYSGIFSPNEAASIGAFCTILLGFIKKTLSWSDFIKSIENSVLVSAGLFLIIFGATVFATFIVQTRLPDTLLSIALSMDLSPLFIMILIIIIYIILGCFLEGIGMILITVPVFLPIIEGYGYNVIWFGIILVILVELGLITPPVGMNLFIIKAQTDNLSISRLYTAIIPFLFAPLLLIILLFWLPDLALWLPKKLY